MPAKLDSCVKQVKAGWKKNPGSRPKSKEDDESLAIAICRSKLKLETEQEENLKGGYGPTLVNVAATIKPHLRQRDHEIRLVEENGQEVVEIPIAERGIYRHSRAPGGKLIFNQAFFDYMIRNHNNKVTDYNVALDLRHTDEHGALAWIDTSDGGRLEMRDSWLYAIGIPTDEASKELIRTKRYRYASAEFFYNYKSNQMFKLSTDELEPVDEEGLLQEENMTRKIILGQTELSLQEKEGAFALDEAGVKSIEEFIAEIIGTQQELQQLTAKLEQKETELTALKDKVEELEKDDESNEDEAEIPEAVRLRLEELEEQNAGLIRARQAEKIALTMAHLRDRVDDKGNGHSKTFLDLIEAGLKLESYEEGDISVKLEGDDTQDAISFYRNLLVAMGNHAPGTVPRRGQTGAEDVRPADGFGLEQYGFTQEELEAEIKEFQDKY